MLIIDRIELTTGRAAIIQVQNNDLVQVEHVDQKRRLSRDDDLALQADTTNHLSNQFDRLRMQAQLWLVQEQHTRHHLGGEVE